MTAAQTPSWNGWCLLIVFILYILEYNCCTAQELFPLENHPLIFNIISNGSSWQETTAIICWLQGNPGHKTLKILAKIRQKSKNYNQHAVSIATTQQELKSFTCLQFRKICYQRLKTWPNNKYDHLSGQRSKVKHHFVVHCLKRS